MAVSWEVSGSTIVPETVITALSGVAYKEKVTDKPAKGLGHIEAKFKKEDGVMKPADLSSLLDDFNDRLTTRKGACTITR